MRISLGNIQAATQASALVAPSCPDTCATGITWDSREVQPGFVYLALPGERVDGHSFVASAVDKGAVAAVVMHDLDESTHAHLEHAGAALLLVDDTREALVRLARYWRGCLDGTVLGLTGSTGKTTTKNLVRDVLSHAFSVVATQANQNNELGVPKTLLNASADTDVVVVEMGMRGLGQINELCAFAQPSWGLITNVGESHIELLGSRDNIARAKGELLENLPDNGVAFINAADEYSLRALERSQAQSRGVRTVFFDGSLKARQKEGCACVWAQDITFDERCRPSFTLCAAGFESFGFAGTERVSCTLALRGLHNVSNAASAAAVGCALGMSLADCAAALAQAQPEAGRQEMIRSRQGALIINDSYNANPDSMRAALCMLDALDVPGRKIAVLGDMGELGSFAPECHERIGALCSRLNLDALVCVGELSRFIASAARQAGFDDSNVVCLDTTDQAIPLLKQLVSPEDAVLVKASHFMAFGTIVEGLIE